MIEIGSCARNILTLTLDAFLMLPISADQKRVQHRNHGNATTVATIVVLLPRKCFRLCRDDSAQQHALEPCAARAPTPREKFVSPVPIFVAMFARLVKTVQTAQI